MPSTIFKNSNFFTPSRGSSYRLIFVLFHPLVFFPISKRAVAVAVLSFLSSRFAFSLSLFLYMYIIYLIYALQDERENERSDLCRESRRSCKVSHLGICELSTLRLLNFIDRDARASSKIVQVSEIIVAHYQKIPIIRFAKSMNESFAISNLRFQKTHR